MQGIEAGSYNCEVIARDIDGMIYTFPTNGYFNVQIIRNLERGEWDGCEWIVRTNKEKC